MHVNSGTLKNRPEAQDTHSLEGSTSDSGPYQKKAPHKKHILISVLRIR